MPLTKTVLKTLRVNNPLLHCISYSRDRKRKRFVGTDGQDPKRKKVKTESGTWIPASYKTNAYPLEKVTKNNNSVYISVILRDN